MRELGKRLKNDQGVESCSYDNRTLFYTAITTCSNIKGTCVKGLLVFEKIKSWKVNCFVWLCRRCSLISTFLFSSLWQFDCVSMVNKFFLNCWSCFWNPNLSELFIGFITALFRGTVSSRSLSEGRLRCPLHTFRLNLQHRSLTVVAFWIHPIFDVVLLLQETPTLLGWRVWHFSFINALLGRVLLAAVIHTTLWLSPSLCPFYLQCNVVWSCISM